MPTREPRSTLTVRVTKAMRDRLYDRALRYGPPADVIREIIRAFIEDRLQIEAPTTTKMKELFSVRNQD